MKGSSLDWGDFAVIQRIGPYGDGAGRKPSAQWGARCRAPYAGAAPTADQATTHRLAPLNSVSEANLVLLIYRKVN